MPWVACRRRGGWKQGVPDNHTPAFSRKNASLPRFCGVFFFGIPLATGVSETKGWADDAAASTAESPSVAATTAGVAGRAAMFAEGARDQAQELSHAAIRMAASGRTGADPDSRAHRPAREQAAAFRDARSSATIAQQAAKAAADAAAIMGSAVAGDPGAVGEDGLAAFVAGTARGARGGGGGSGPTGDGSDDDDSAGGSNGDDLPVDLNSSTSGVDDSHKFILRLDGTLDLVRTLAHFMSITYSGDTEKASELIAWVSRDSGWISIIFSMAQMYRLAVSATPACRFIVRSSDTVPAAVLDGMKHAAKTKKAARAIVRWAKADSSNAAKVQKGSELVFSALVAVAIHRQLTNGHSWITSHTTKAGSVAARALAVAGSEIEAFRPFMINFGHDVWHHLSNDSLFDFASACTKDDTIDMYDLYVTDENFRWGGRPMGLTHVSDIAALQDSAIDRYPTSMMGKAAVLTGLNLLKSMLSTVGFKVVVRGQGQVLANIDAIRDAISDFEGERSVLLAARKSLNGIVCTAYGFAATGIDEDSVASSYPALAALAKSNSAAKETGSQLAKVLRGE